MKDQVLFNLSRHGNVAAFASFGTDSANLRFSSISPLAPQLGADLDSAVRSLLAGSADNSVNIRTFRPDMPKGCPFIYGLTKAEEVASRVRDFAASGYFTIVNETIDVADGGVSGVALGDVMEFAPNSTPRAVDEPGAASMNRDLAARMLRQVYGFEIELPESLSGRRVEFSVHPKRRGTRSEHIVLWEEEAAHDLELIATTVWPNRFSRHLGDKVFGLMMVWLHGLDVPRSTVISRQVAPFTFGNDTGTYEHWIRTSPREQEPGRFTTSDRWVDPFALLQREDPTHSRIASVISQSAVRSRYSGATLPGASDEEPLIEGVIGDGIDFMLGRKAPESLPPGIVDDVRYVHARASSYLGPVRLEWVHDGERTWIVQAHMARSAYKVEDVILSGGHAAEWVSFHVEDGLEVLLEVIHSAQKRGAGVLVEGDVGITSHVGDLLRKAHVPARRLR